MSTHDVNHFPSNEYVVLNDSLCLTGSLSHSRPASPVTNSLRQQSLTSTT